tara:strand:- start:107 stop:340 length:234 start_codon:yes stop_codon:yes gene_type:complete
MPDVNLFYYTFTGGGVMENQTVQVLAAKVAEAQAQIDAAYFASVIARANRFTSTNAAKASIEDVAERLAGNCPHAAV